VDGYPSSFSTNQSLARPKSLICPTMIPRKNKPSPHRESAAPRRWGPGGPGNPARHHLVLRWQRPWKATASSSPGCRQYYRDITKGVTGRSSFKHQRCLLFCLVAKNRLFRFPGGPQIVDPLKTPFASSLPPQTCRYHMCIIVPSRPSSSSCNPDSLLGSR